MSKTKIGSALALAALIAVGGSPAEAKRLFRGSGGKFFHEHVNPHVTKPLRDAVVAAGTAGGAIVGGAVGAPTLGAAVGAGAGHVANSAAAGKL